MAFFMSAAKRPMKLDDLFAALQQNQLAPLDEFRARITSERLAHPDIDSLYAMRAARIMHVPFQYKPLLRLLRADQRWLSCHTSMS